MPDSIIQDGGSLTSAVDQLTESSLKIAQATADYGALKIMFAIFAIFTFLLVILFVYQIVNIMNKVNNIHQTIVKTDQYFQGIYDRTIGTTQAQVILRRGFNYLGHALKYYILRIRIENHIEGNKAKVTDKVNMIIKNEFNEFDSYLSNFVYRENPLNFILEEEDQKVIKTFMVEQIYISKENFTVSAMDQAVDILINGIKLEYVNKLNL